MWQGMIAYQKENGIKAAAVIGGGLLGLEAAKAMYDLGMETHIIEYAPILMARQVMMQRKGHKHGESSLGGAVRRVSPAVVRRG